MNLANLLQSENSAVRSRALQHLTMNLQINPVSCISFFGSFSDGIIHNFFNEYTRNSLVMSIIIPKLIQAVQSHMKEIPNDSTLKLLHFFIECLKNCYDSIDKPLNQKNSIYFASTYVPVLEQILKNETLESINHLNLEEIFILIQYNIAIPYLSRHLDKILALILNQPEFAAISLWNLMENKGSASIALSCLNKLHEVHKDIFLQYFAGFQNFLRRYFPRDINRVLFNDDNFSYDYTKTVVAIAAAGQFNRYYGCFTDNSPNLLFRITHNPKVDADNLTQLATHNSAEELLRGNEKIKARLPSMQKSNSGAKLLPLARNRSFSTFPPKKQLSSFAEKKGGLGHKSWQRRYLDFYPHNNVIVWKDDPKSKEIKGLLVLSRTTNVAFKTKSAGHMYKLIISSGEKQKSYELSFDTKELAQEWYNTLNRACIELTDESK